MKVDIMYYTIYEGDLVPYVALAKETPFVVGMLPHEPGEVVYACGFTKEYALRNLKDRLPDNNWDWVEWEEKE